MSVALLVPPPLAGEVNGLRRALDDPSLRRIAPHITLVPPVDLREEQVPEALALLRSAAAALCPFEVRLGPVASFLPGKPVAYLAVGGEGAALVAALRDRLLRPPLWRDRWEREERAFVPHVTVCQKAPPGRIEAAARVLDGFGAHAVFDRAHMLLKEPERAWEPFADAPLAAPAVVGRGGLPTEITVSEQADPDVAAWAAGEWQRHGAATYGALWIPDQPFVLTARREGKVAGLAECTVRGRTCLLERLMVAAAERSQGVGSALLAAVEAAAADRGCTRAELCALARGPAQAFYEGRGWVVTGALPSWREGRDFVRMERAL